MFLREFLTDWKTVGAIAPSSPALAERMADVAHVSSAQRVLELGPGTGALTEAIRKKLAPGSCYLGIERNKAFADQLCGKFPELHFAASCILEYDLDEHCRGNGGYFDAVVSGLPWTAFPHSLQEQILDHVIPRLAPGGRFVTFAYTGFHWLPAGQRFHSLLKRRLPQVRRTSTVWLNVFPAFVYVGTNQ